MEDSKQPQQKRQVAYKTRVKSILEGEYVKQEGWNPNYIKLFDGSKVSRVNLIGAIVLKKDEQNHNTIIIEDGSGKVPVRDFDKKGIFDSVGVGDVVLVIGRPREFGEKYVVPEIVKKVEDPLWIDVRKLELKKKTGPEKKEKDPEKPQTEAEEVEEGSTPAENILRIIKEEDKGKGVDVEDIISSCDEEGTEKVIRRLLEEGEIFELKPGIVKILE